MSLPAETAPNFVFIFNYLTRELTCLLVITLSLYAFHCFTRRDARCFPFLVRYPEVSLDYWYQRYGPIYSMWLGNQLCIVVSDPGIAKDLYVTNGAVFSSRKDMFIKNRTIFIGRGITPMPYNDTWRKHRRIAASWLNVRSVDSYTHIIDYEASALVRDLYAASSKGTAAINPQSYAGRCSLNNMLAICFGSLRTTSIDDPLVAQALHFSREWMNLTSPTSNLVDFITPLQWIPTFTRCRGKKLHRELVEVYGGIIKDIEVTMASGGAYQDCLAKTLIENRTKEELDDMDIVMMISAFMIGGVETTASIMQWFLALIPAYPEVQRTAQDELDRVVGRERMPTLDDEKNLPYCRSIIKEIERCHNPFWIVTPHSSTEDFSYRGWIIPKDTVVILNTWSMHHDPSRFPCAHEFRPERYVNDTTSSAESASLANPYERDNWMFGAGRRICPGILVAEREIWLTISRLLWAFNMAEIPGEPIDLNEYDGLSARSPVPFRIKLEPRHEKVGQVMAF
ncbi:cytochrome P450 [Punctularia strigosozonata HHB-11173 SS5]|uniref:Cytochrome P450 n=1 Tax=Punctularia strigosozonata (strain HHB-11173) TaxID=741275 RepID=R7S441_PUNST|nr:cytochrome P450 [Punctularia strigosozonata HHB-11173 SS5]EIN04006.1 cytochrome P450 [Punctularia strigosozonata HHB-11173 SS5]